MKNKNAGVRVWVASFIAVVIMSAPWGVLLLSDEGSSENNSWQRGLVTAPLILLIATFLCRAIAGRLLAAGCTSLRKFTLAAAVSTCAGVLALIMPFIVVGACIDFFTVVEALLPALALCVVLGVSALPAAAFWWCAVGN